jgi:hypothetical protein
MVNELLNEEVKLRVLNRIGAMVKEGAIRKCPTDNGILRNSIDFRTEGNKVTIFSEVPYAEYVEFGTGRYHLDLQGQPSPHKEWDILPKHGKFLKFEIGRKERLAAKKGPSFANIVFARKVHMKGARPKPFLRPALMESLPEINRIVAEAFNK